MSSILGVETDAVWIDRGETKTVSKILAIDEFDDFNDEFEDDGVALVVLHWIKMKSFKRVTQQCVALVLKQKGLVQHGFVLVFPSLTALCLMLPMVLPMRKYKVSIKFQKQKSQQNGKSSKAVSATIFDKTKTMVGFTLGGGIDFVMTDHILLRAEYCYSDFGKKEFKKGYLKLGYKTNDFHVGVAYKF